MAPATGTVDVKINWEHQFPCNHVFPWHSVVPPTHCPHCGACLHYRHYPVYPYPYVPGYPGVPHYPQPWQPTIIWSTSTPTADTYTVNGEKVPRFDAE